MGEWLMGKVKGLGFAILGMVLTLGWWSIRGGGGEGGYDEDRPLPGVVHEGGRSVSVDFTTSHEADFSATFECGDEEAEYGHERIEPGNRYLTFEVPGWCDYAIFEAQIAEPPVGAQMSWTVRVEGRTWDEDSMTLEAPLASGYAFFLQSGWEDATLDEWLEWNEES